MVRLYVLISSMFISTALTAVNGYPGSIELHRVARSPHYGGFGFPPPPPFPFFQTNNWSGITKSADGNAHGVYSGAAASATNNGPASGQALSLASADCDDDDSVQSAGSAGKLITGISDGNSGISGGFGGHFSGYKNAHYSYQSGGGKFEGSQLNGQSATGSQGQLNYGASNSAAGHETKGQIKGSGFSSSGQDNAQAGGSLGVGDQAGGFSSSNAQSLSFAHGKDNSNQQAALTSNLNSQNADCENQEQENIGSSSQNGASVGYGQEHNRNQHENLGFDGFGQKTNQHYEHGQYEGHGIGLNHQTQNSYGQQNHFGGEFEQQKEQLSDFGQQQAAQIGQQDQLTQPSGNGHQQGQASVGQQQNQAAFGQTQGQVAFGQHQGQGGFLEHQGQQFKQQDLQGGKSASSQASSFGYGGGFGYGKGFPGYGHQGYGRDLNSKYQINQDLQQHQSGAEFNREASGSQSAGIKGSSNIGGALNLASQSLDAAQKAGCSTCGGGGYAFSNAKSQTGSAISVAIGG